MFKLHAGCGLVLACLVVFAPITAYARANFVMDAPWAIHPDLGINKFTDGVYHRETYPHLGGFLQIFPSHDNNLDDGDTWVVAVDLFPFLGSQPIRLGAAHLVYDAATDCLLFEGTPATCEARWPPDAPTFGSKLLGFTIFFDAQCINVADYQLAGEFNASGGPIEQISDSPWPFRPTEFPLGTPQVLVAQTNIRPMIPKFPTTAGSPNDIPGLRNPAEPPGQTRLVAFVEDGIQRLDGSNCRKALPDIEMTLENIVVSKSGSHVHFTNPKEPGTGRYLGVAAGSPRHRIIGKTNQLGNFFATYQAGEFGVDETVTAFAVDPMSNNNVPSEPVALRIEIPGLVPLDTSGFHYTLAGTGSPVDLRHNLDAVNPALRLSHYVTENMFFTVQAMADIFFGETGIVLSLNDGSLQYGGIFDESDADRTADIHDTHRFGVDIDVNRGGPRGCPNPADPDNLSCLAKHPDYPPTFTRRDVLTDIVERDLFGMEMIEGPIHYRFLNDR